MTEVNPADRYIVERTVVDRESVLRQVAVDRLLGREVLVTRLRGRAGRRTLIQQSFRSGAEAAAKLNHPHIVAMFDLEQENGMPYCVQEYANAESLREIIDHEGPFHPDDVAALVGQITDALDYAAQRSVPHGGIRPETIIVDYDGTVLISDFGIGPVLDGLDDPSPDLIAYRAPEILAGLDPSPAADIYALGVIAYEMLTGELPFDGNDVAEMTAAIRAGYPDAPSQVNSDVPPALNAPVLTAMSFNPSARFGFAGDFGDALTNWREAAVDPRTHPSATLQMPGFVEPAPSTENVPDVLIPVEDEAEHVEGRSGGRLVSVLAWTGAAIALLVIAWISYGLLTNDNDPGINRLDAPLDDETATVVSGALASPTAASVVGMTVDEAENAVDTSIRISATETSNSVPEGHIIRQSPNPGNLLRTNEIVVVVSSGAGPIQLNTLEVANRPFDEVGAELTAMGLNVIPVDEGSTDIAEGNVIRIDEQTAEVGDDVHLVVSKGDVVQIPSDIQSLPIDEAVTRLEDLGLTVNEPIGVSRSRIEAAFDPDEFDIVDGDMVGIQEADASFGSWVPADTEVTPVFYDADLDE
jgi:serine/threonine protein kinase